MYVIRDLMHCKPGKVRPLVEKFLKMGELLAKHGGSSPRVMTDVAGEHFWTLAAEFEVESLEAFAEMEKSLFADPAAQEVMADYHDLVADGRREIYRLES